MNLIRNPINLYPPDGILEQVIKTRAHFMRTYGTSPRRMILGVSQITQLVTETSLPEKPTILWGMEVLADNRFNCMEAAL